MEVNTAMEKMEMPNPTKLAAANIGVEVQDTNIDKTTGKPKV